MECPDCGSGVTEYVLEISSEICTNCGTLVQSSRDTLVDLSEPQTYDEGRAVVNDTIFSGEGKKGYSGRVQASKCHNTLQHLCSSLQCPSLAPRACNIFDNAIRIGQIRYGHLSTLVAGASAAIALRESGSRECLAEITVCLGVKMAPLTRMFAKVRAILDINLPPNDPALYFPTLLKKVSSLSSQVDSSLSPKLKNYLNSVQFAAVSRLAVSLAALPQDVSLHRNRAFPAVASAYIIMAFEGELGEAMPDYRQLIRHLALHVGFGDKTIEERYRELTRLVTDWRRHLPWADQITKTKQGTATRDANARYLKDVVAFQTQLKVKALGFLKKEDIPDDDASFDCLEADRSEDDEFWEAHGDFDFQCPTSPPRPLASLHSSPPCPIKKRRLSPLGPRYFPSTATENPDKRIYFSNAGRPDAYVHPTKRPGTARKEAMHRAVSSLVSPTPGAENPLDTDFMPAISCSAGDLRRAVLHRPFFATELSSIGRLTALCISRGGEEYIDDEELFGKGEFESILRGEGERAALRAVWALQDQMHDETPTSAVIPQSTR